MAASAIGRGLVALLTLVLIPFGSVGCGAESSAPPAPSAVAAASDGPHSVEAPVRFEPAVEKDAIAPGAWICDMGSVHYAQPGEGECPICGMDLVEYAGAEVGGDHAGHGHR
ncbi:MAG: heavy metal-binding domain-containing protein [Myxococcota bacterium]